MRANGSPLHGGMNGLDSVNLRAGFPISALLQAASSWGPGGFRWMGRPVPRQHLHRAAVADIEIRMRLSACLGERVRSEGGHSKMDNLL